MIFYPINNNRRNLFFLLRGQSILKYGQNIDFLIQYQVKAAVIVNILSNHFYEQLYHELL